MNIVVGIITRKNRILIGKVKKEKINVLGGIEYIFPGGEVEEGESIEEACIREVREETGYNVKVVTRIGKRIHPKTGKEVHYYHCEVKHGEESSLSHKNDDIEKLKWVDIKKLKEYMPSLFTDVYDYLRRNVKVVRK